jgi:hypothetical protein
MKEVPSSLRTWFVIHFVVDMLTGIPLLLFPELVMPLLGWNTIDPIASRVVGAAMLGIGIESWLGRDAGIDVYRAMLNLKVIWSGSAIFGIALGLRNGGPLGGWLFLGAFLGFFFLWTHYRRMLKT